MIAQLAARMGNYLRPRDGWLPFLLLLCALLSFPAAMVSGTRDPALSLFILAAISAIVGLRLARPRVSARIAVLVAVLSGVMVSALVVGRLLPPLPMLWTDATQATSRLAAWFQGADRGLVPFDQSAGYVWQQVNLLAFRLWWWLQRAGTGTQAQDTIALELFSAFLVWILGLYATWHLYRRRAALKGLLPGGTVVAIVSFFRGGTSLFYLVTYLFCTLWFLAICHFWTRRDGWEQDGVDYPGGLGLELALALTPWLVPLLLLAAFFPVLYPRPLREAIWRVLDAPWARVEQSAERFLGPIEGLGPALTAGRPVGPGELPSDHLLGGRPELSEQVVLYVTTNDPPPPTTDSSEPPLSRPARYWRSRTFDTYTGSGWTNEPLESMSLQPGQALDPAPAAGAVLIQQVQRLDPDVDLVFAANAPLRVDHPVEAWWRAPGDLARMTGEADLYTVLSRPQKATVADLRAATSTDAGLPAPIAKSYLSLPGDLPERVIDLAWQIVGDAGSHYDRARAIERFLRAYPYNLDIPQPPSNRDLVDYFLFDLQEGYCDYYASAMVVMARAVGVPARLASGYAQGTYDPAAGRWVITELNGHSWVEVYFEEIGWVEFEPTAGLAALERRGGDELPVQGTLPLPPRRAPWWQAIPWTLLLLATAILALLGFIVWLWRPRPAAAALIRDRQARLLRWGTRLRRPIRDGQTPLEYARHLSAAVRDSSQRASLSRTKSAGQQAPAEIEQLSDAYTRARYSPHPVAERDGWTIRDLWSRLRRHLWWLWLTARPGSTAGSKAESRRDDRP